MTDADYLNHVKKALAIEGNYLDNTLTEWIAAVKDFLLDSGVLPKYIDAGIVAQGVSDLYASNAGQFSRAFTMRATQLAYKR